MALNQILKNELRVTIMCYIYNFSIKFQKIFRNFTVTAKIIMLLLISSKSFLKQKQPPKNASTTTKKIFYATRTRTYEK
jgi:hypothetical protein